MRALLLMLLALVAASCSEAPPPHRPAPPGGGAIAVFAGGCFWCTESDFEHLPGVVEAVSGYTGGHTARPTYEEVSAGGTGHYEAVRVRYDPSAVSYAQLVRHFLRSVDPTDGGGQFCDRGDSYRTAIFVATPEERREAEAALAEAGRTLRTRLATRILPLGAFTEAEAYHQDYYRRNPIRYAYYRSRCGRDARLREVWGTD